ncbi:hypothetical protein [Nocardiopsis sp. NRRL B-16309]|uniref:hypothetical protein n=1 Tax=Nocardiopsis sp. NRRL B-16309 TaxID=1519494 RepID=UPI0006AE3321|nr:hypothetical protein [Nocardiopsis sp. NRRL B-16309]KOX12475.1 hypothetical protein ADL05_21615 [Nocardiopsis sp. NRRL B-16309]
MQLDDLTRESLVTARRLLVGGAIAALAVFGTAACEDTGDDDPAVEQEDEGEGEEDAEGEEEDDEDDAPGGY